MEMAQTVERPQTTDTGDKLWHSVCTACQAEARISGSPIVAYCGKIMARVTHRRPAQATPDKCLVCVEAKEQGCPIHGLIF